MRTITVKIKLITLTLYTLATCAGVEAMQASKVRLATNFAAKTIKAAANTIKTNPYKSLAAVSAITAGKYVHYRHSFYEKLATKLERQAAASTNVQAQIDRLIRERKEYLAGSATSDAKVAKTEELSFKIEKLRNTQSRHAATLAQATAARAAAQRAAQTPFMHWYTRHGSKEDIALVSFLAGAGIAAYIAFIIAVANPAMEDYRKYQLWGIPYSVPKSLNFEWFPKESTILYNYQDALVYSKNFNKYFYKRLAIIGGACAVVAAGMHIRAWLAARDRAANIQP